MRSPWPLLATLLVLVVAWPARSATSLEELVADSTAVVRARVLDIRKGEPDRLTVEVLETLSGKSPGRAQVTSFARSLGEPLPAVGSERLLFLRWTDVGWFPTRPDGFRPPGQAEQVKTLVQVRRSPRLFLSSAQTDLVRAALRFLVPQQRDREDVTELLHHSDFEVRMRAAKALAEIDPRTAGDWLFAHWTVDTQERFLRFHQLVTEVLGRSLFLALDTREDRQLAVEAHQIAWWLANPSEEEKAFARLPELAERVRSDSPGWALEALSLYPPGKILPPLADAIVQADEESVSRMLAILSQALTRPDPEAVQILSGPAGARLRSALAGLAAREYTHPSLQAYVPSEARRLLHAVENYAELQERLRTSP